MVKEVLVKFKFGDLNAVCRMHALTIIGGFYINFDHFPKTRQIATLKPSPKFPTAT